MQLTIRLRHVALAALVGVFAAAGIAYGVIPGPDGAIQACFKKSGGALRVIDASLGACAANENALAWSQTGPSGPAGPPGLSGYEIAVAERENTAGFLRGGQRASCPEGKVVIGGGAGVDDEEGLVHGDVVQSRPSSDGAGWFAFFRVDSPAVAFTTSVYAICAAVEP